MKTFDNYDANDFMKSIKDYGDRWNVTTYIVVKNKVNQWFPKSVFLMSQISLYSENKPVVELLFGDKINHKNKVCLLSGSQL